jgi:L-iditol 2-dehydrogenase
MRGAMLYGQMDLRLETVPDPEPGQGEVVIKVGAATTCGTDLKVWRRGGHARMLRPPTLFGHEAAGEIAALGEGVDGWAVGDRVVANNSAPCLHCFFCQRREYSLCQNLLFNNGTFAEYLKIPAPIVQQNLLAIPPGVSFGLAAMTEPLACVLHGLSRSGITPRAQDQPPLRVAVIGDGAIGLMFVAAIASGLGDWLPEASQSPKASGAQKVAEKVAEVFLFGGNDSRLQVGLALGANQVFNYKQIPSIPEQVKRLSEGWGADVVIEATGVPQVWETAIAAARPGGVVNLFGGCPKQTVVTVSTEQLHYGELTLKGVFHNTPFFVRSALALLASQQLPLHLLLSEARSLNDLDEVFQAMLQRQVIKVAMLP